MDLFLGALHTDFEVELRHVVSEDHIVVFLNVFVLEVGNVLENELRILSRLFLKFQAYFHGFWIQGKT